MEPNLEEIDDYNKPLKSGKLKTILLAFGAAIAVYVLYLGVMTLFS